MTTRQAVIRSLSIIVAALAVVSPFWWYVSSSNASDARYDHDVKAAFSRANTICGGPPSLIKTHGSSWSYGPWIEVVCTDGSVRAVQP